MKNQLLLLTFLLFSSSMLHAQEFDQKRIDVANKMVLAVQDYSTKKILKCLDNTYRIAQTAFLDGNTEQLVNELFGGNDDATGEYFVFKIEEIRRIEIAEIIEENSETFTYIFRIRDETHDILCSLTLKRVKNKWGFQGGVG